MRVAGNHAFAAPREVVWAVLTDPAALARCTPGCKTLESVGADAYRMELELGVAAIKGRYTGTLRILDPRPAEGYRLQLEARGTPGWVSGTWELTLRTTGDGGTDLAYVGDAQVGGLIAGVGQRVLGGVTSMVLKQLFTALGQEVERR